MESRGPFASLGRRNDQVQFSGEGRRFIGDGTEFLEVRGLRMLEGVTMGHRNPVTIPMMSTLELPHPTKSGETVEAVIEMLRVELDDDRTPILLRHMTSNDGKWNEGETFTVYGSWEDPTQFAVGGESAPVADGFAEVPSRLFGAVSSAPVEPVDPAAGGASAAPTDGDDGDGTGGADTTTTETDAAAKAKGKK